MKALILTASKMKKTIDGREYSGKCVTALDYENNRLLRFVGHENGAPLGNPECNIFQPLDIVDITVLKECPILCQTENVLCDYKHVKALGQYTGSLDDLHKRVYRITNRDRSFLRDGFGKLEDISRYHHSLEMVKVTQLKITGNKCSFRIGRREYWKVSITDESYKMPEGMSKEIGDAYIVMSIPTDSYNELGYYKFVAAVFPVENTGMQGLDANR